MQITKTLGTRSAATGMFFARAKSELASLVMLSACAVVAGWVASLALDSLGALETAAKVLILISYAVIAFRLGWRIAARHLLMRNAWMMEAATVLLVLGVIAMVLGL